MLALAPLIPRGGLGVALFSYEGKLCWGFNGDFELVPDLSSFVDDIAASFEGLRQATVDRYLGRRTASPESPSLPEAESVEVPVAETPAEVAEEEVSPAEAPTPIALVDQPSSAPEAEPTEASAPPEAEEEDETPGISTAVGR